MTLPKIEYPIAEVKLGDKSYKFRPMLVKEEKILLTARQGENEGDIFTAIKQVVQNCSVDDKLNVEDLPIFLLEYAFLSLRIASIGGVLELSYKDSEDDMEYKFTVNLEDIKIKYADQKVSEVIKVTDDIEVIMQYPPASLYSNPDFLNSPDATKYFEELLFASIKSIYSNSEEIVTKGIARQEMIDFIDSLDSQAYKRMQDFLGSVPHMEHVIKYTNKKGTEREIVLRTLNDFFML